MNPTYTLRYAASLEYAKIRAGIFSILQYIIYMYMPYIKTITIYPKIRNLFYTTGAPPPNKAAKARSQRREVAPNDPAVGLREEMG